MPPTHVPNKEPPRKSRWCLSTHVHGWHSALAPSQPAMPASQPEAALPDGAESPGHVLCVGRLPTLPHTYSVERDGWIIIDTGSI